MCRGVLREGPGGHSALAKVWASDVPFSHVPLPKLLNLLRLGPERYRFRLPALLKLLNLLRLAARTSRP